MKIDILKKTDITSEIQSQITDLFKELSSNKKQVSLSEILHKNNNISLIYCIENKIVIGIASMCTYDVISGKKGWIEDVVVSSKHRGKGIGRKMMHKLLEIGKEKQLTEILLFTEDHRTPAIKLYSNLGFKVKNTRVYSKK